jgi:hypothetical protein
MPEDPASSATEDKTPRSRSSNDGRRESSADENDKSARSRSQSRSEGGDGDDAKSGRSRQSRKDKDDAKSSRSAGGKSSKSKSGKSSKSDKKSSRSRRSERSSNGDFGDEELEGLISFSNLESVVRHIMARFKGFEDRTNSLDEKVKIIQVDLKAKATKQDLDLECNKLRVMHKDLEKNYERIQDHVRELQDAHEYVKANLLTLDKRMETFGREKEMSDRIMREMQDNLHDKATLTELHLFEAKFANYTPREDHQALIELLGEFTRVEVTEKLAEFVKSISVKFEEYLRPPQVEMMLQDMNEKIRAELVKYAKVETTEKDIRDMESELKDASVNHERALHVIEEKMRALADKVTSVYSELNDEVQRRALQTKIDDINASLKGYALQSDQSNFKQECLPKLKFCMETINQFTDRLSAQDNAIMRVDEVLLQKASKWDVKVVDDKMEKAIRKDAAMRELKKHEDQMNRMQAALDHYVATEGERFAAQTGPDYGNDVQRLAKTLELKADKADLAELFALKANRNDSEELSRNQDVVQKQLQYLTATTVGLSKLTLNDAHPNESKGLRNQQKMQVLMQAESLWGWILNKVAPENVGSVAPGKGAQQSRYGASGPMDKGAEHDRQNRLAERLGLLEKGDDKKNESSSSLPGIRKAATTSGIVRGSPRMSAVKPSASPR